MCRFPGIFSIIGLGSWVALAAALGAAPAAGANPPQSTRDLVRTDRPTLDALYAAGSAGRIPDGFTPGRPIVNPGTRVTVPASRLLHPLWQGKVFNGDGTGMNRVFGVNAIPVKVYLGESWKDGGPAVIVDYADSWKPFRKVRDEFREVSPGLYLGMTYIRDCPEPKLAMMFALQERNGCKKKK